MLVHPVDVYMKLDEYVRCLIKLSTGDQSSARKVAAQDVLIDALNMIESTQIQLLRKDQIARLMVNKGICLSKLDKFCIIIYLLIIIQLLGGKRRDVPSHLLLNWI